MKILQTLFLVETSNHMQYPFFSHLYCYLKKRNRTRENENYFFDRSSIDCIAYLKANKLGITTEITQIIKQCVFNKQVFITPFWEEIYINDGERMEDIKAAINIESSIIETYKSLGYTLVKVPKLSVSERVNFILSNI